MPPKHKKGPKKKKAPKNKEQPTDAFMVLKESFLGSPVSIVCRSRSRRCLLVGLANVLLLRRDGSLDTSQLTGGASLSLKKLISFVLSILEKKLQDQHNVLVTTEQRELCRSELEELGSKTAMDLRFRRVDHYTHTRKMNLFSVLGVPRRHALIPNPEDTLLYNSIKDKSSAELCKEFMEYESGCESGEHYEQSYHDKMSVVKDFVVNGPEFTSYGLDCLQKEALEDSFFLLHLNQDLHVVYKRDEELYLLASEEDLQSKYPDIMWLGLDENFNVENPAETKIKLTSTFTPIHESWAVVLNQFLQELEDEKRRPEREIEAAVSQEKAQSTCLQTEVDTDDSQVEIQTKVDTNDSQVETAEDKGDSQKCIEMNQPKLVVQRRFLRFVHRCLLSLKKFTSSYKMFKIYHFKGQRFSSTSHLARLMAKGYLVFIFKTHKSGYCWNGDFKEENMFVELEVVDGLVSGATNFFITLTAFMTFTKEYGVADLEKFVQIVFPCCLAEGFAKLPFYFRSFEADIIGMPDSHDPPEKLETFQKYMADHFFAKAPLVRSTLVSSVYGLLDPEIIHSDQSSPKPRHVLLDVELSQELLKSFKPLYWSDPLKRVYFGGRVETRFTRSNRWTSWDLIELGRHSTQHLMSKTLENGVQLVQDPVIIDLIVEHDMCGLLTEAIKLMMQKTNFKGRFETTWEQFSGSEPKDDGETIPSIFGVEDVEVEEEPDTAAMQAAATVATTQEQENFIMNDYGFKFTEEGLRSVKGENWIFDEVIDFVYCELQTKFMSIEDLVLVLPNVAHALTNLPRDSDPFQILDPGSSNMFLFPLNDSQDHGRADSGSHWSLVVLHVDRTKSVCKFVHHDSVQNKNRDAAERLVENLKKLFPSFHSSSSEGQSPQQANGYDCGVYVIAISLQIARWYKRVKNGKELKKDWVDEVCKVTSQMVSNERQEIYVKLKRLFRFKYPGFFDEEESSDHAGAE